MTGKTPAQKLLIKAEHQVLILNPPEDYESLLGKIPARQIFLNQTCEKPDVILAFLENRAALETHLPEIKPLLTSKTLLWLCYHKGTSRVKTDINRDTINAYCMSNGLQGIAMISIDEDWSALRLKMMG